MNKTFNISVPSDERGFIGRACDSPDCKQYFKILIPDHKETLICPYCGSSFSKTDLLTGEQLDHVRRAAAEEVKAYAFDEIQKMFKNATRGSKNLTFEPGRRPPKHPVVPAYKEREVDTELECCECNTQFQVYGIFGYCPGCKCENLQIYDTNWSIIKRGIDNSNDKNRQLRHAYSDLISTFEMFCSRKAKKITSETGHFQVLFDACKFFKQHARVDMLAVLSQPALLSLRRVFQKRHVCIHAGGIINARYIKMIPEDAKLLGTAVILTETEFEEAAAAIRSVLAELVRCIERPGK